MEVPTHRPRTDRPPAGASVPLIRVGTTPCRLEVWADAEYHARRQVRRPVAAAYHAGLGWVVALAVDSPN